jgi:3-phenylpropionate/cinnamic acid dioxygenase small subunit
MRVIKTETGGSRRENYSAHSARRDEGRSFFGSAIHVSGDHLAMPVQLLRSVCVVVDFDRRWLIFFETQ